MVAAMARPHGSESTLEHGTETRLVRRRVLLGWSERDRAKELAIEEGALVGTAEGATLVLADRAVSRVHARLELREDGLWVQDLESRNGTYVDDVRVERARIGNDGRLRVGATTITVRYDGQPRSIELWRAHRFGPLVGVSPVMRELFARLAKMAPTASSVLVHGETGTGKELVARAIHDASTRAGGPFIVVDCAALPESLVESELFGHAKGAFTGAVSQREGAVEAAEGGTLFLDEVGELPLSVQPKLLRVLESREFRRVGEASHRKADIRVVSATHRDLLSMVSTGAFREDLYFRLGVLVVTVPPLRARAEDITALAAHLAPLTKLEPGLVVELERRPWLGNVRELRSFLERAQALGTTEALTMSAPAAPRGAGLETSVAGALRGPYKEVREAWIEQLERAYFTELLERHARDVAAAAREAGVDRTYVYRLIRRYGL
jgi:two-component system response regulator GlrR